MKIINCVFICCVVVFIKFVDSKDKTVQYRNDDGRRYQFNVKGKSDGNVNKDNWIKFSLDGGIFKKHLQSIRRLTTSRPTLQQNIKRQTDNYFPTPKPTNQQDNSVSPCINGSTGCMLPQLRNIGLIRSTPTPNTSQTGQVETSHYEYDGSGRSIHRPQTESYDHSQLPRGKGRYRTNCWKSDGKYDQDPAIDYSDYIEEADPTPSPLSKKRYRRKLSRVNRRIGSADSYPCLWQTDWQE